MAPSSRTSPYPSSSMDDVASGVLRRSPHGSCLAPIRCRSSPLDASRLERNLYSLMVSAQKHHSNISISVHLLNGPSIIDTTVGDLVSFLTAGQGALRGSDGPFGLRKKTDWALRTGQNEQAEASARIIPMASSKRGPSVLVSHISQFPFPSCVTASDRTFCLPGHGREAASSRPRFPPATRHRWWRTSSDA